MQNSIGRLVSRGATSDDEEKQRGRRVDDADELETQQLKLDRPIAVGFEMFCGEAGANPGQLQAGVLEPDARRQGSNDFKPSPAAYEEVGATGR